MIDSSALPHGWEFVTATGKKNSKWENLHGKKVALCHFMLVPMMASTF